MAESVDALVSNTSGVTSIPVRPHPSRFDPGSGYKMVELSPCKSVAYEGFLFIYCNIAETFSIFRFKTYTVYSHYSIL